MPRAKPIMGVDVPRLWEAVAVRLARLDLTEQALASQLGIAKQTLWWLHREARNPESDYQPSAQVFLTLCWWLDTNPEEFRKRLRLDPPVAEFVEEGVMTTAPEYPYPAPPGQRWERAPVEGVQLLPVESVNRKCAVYRGPVNTRRSSCNATAVALHDGHLRCGEHLRQEGIWINMGVAWKWALATAEEG